MKYLLNPFLYLFILSSTMWYEFFEHFVFINGYMLAILFILYQNIFLITSNVEQVKKGGN